MRHIPNILSLLRLCLAGVFPFVPPLPQLVLVITALCTDFLDGYIARRWSLVSPLGTLLDPIADKVFALSVALTLFFQSSLRWYELLFFCGREVTIIIGAVSISIARQWGNFSRLRPLLSGKITTVLQFLCFLDYLIFATFHWPLLYLTMLVSFASGMEYMVLFFKTKMFAQ